MDRETRSPVSRSWARHVQPLAADRYLERDPRGWRTHHESFTRPGARTPVPAELREAVRARAFELYLERLSWGWSGSSEGDWLAAEWEVLEGRDGRPQ